MMRAHAKIRRPRGPRSTTRPPAAILSHAASIAPECRAERAVARGLENWLRRRPSFHLLNGTPLDDGGADNIVVGPTGIFVIETRDYRGVVELTSAGLTVDGVAPADDPLRQARRGAAHVRSRLRQGGLTTTCVQAVLCVPYAQLGRPQCVGDILVTRREHLGYLIRHWYGRPLREADAARVFAVLQQSAAASAA